MSQAISAEDVKKTSTAEVFQRLSNGESGFTADEVKKRVEKYGFNELVGEKPEFLKKFPGHFCGPIPWMIEIAAFLSAMIRHWADFILIAILLLVNGVIESWQEHRADNAIELLKQRLALKARALRDGHWQDVEARE
jgi:H+-transporting ATPase